MFWNAKKGTSKPIDQEGMITIKEEYLRKVILNIMEEKNTHVSADEIGSKQIADLLNRMIERNEKEKTARMTEVNEVMEEVKTLQAIKSMIQDMKSQSQAYQQIATSSEQITVSVENEANLVQNVVNITDSTQRVAEEGGEKIDQAFVFVKEAFKSIDFIHEQMKNLMEKTKQINKIVDIVKGIAEQTNLLALNASIEAARAGEAGKGFAVVADEVGKLAEHTKESVFDIQKNVGALEADIKESAATSDQTSAKLDEGKKLVDHALGSIKTIINQITEVNQGIVQISSNVKEQADVTDAITKDITNISQYTDKLLGEGEQIEQTISSLNNKIKYLQ